MDIRILHWFGHDMNFSSPSYDEIILKQYYRKVENDLAIKFANEFIEKFDSALLS